MIRVTPEAVAVIKRSLELASADPSEVGVRLRRAGGQVRPRFADDPHPDDEVIEVEGVRIFVERALATEDVEIAVSPEHDTLIVRATDG